MTAAREMSVPTALWGRPVDDERFVLLACR
jgi:hypothetical protein